MESEVIRFFRAELYLGRVEEAQERRLAGIPISDNYDPRHRKPPPELRVTLTT